jgi:hypothetical protein
MLRKLIPVIACCAFLVTADAPRAEVRAKLSPSTREYQEVQVSMAFTQGQLLVWSVRRGMTSFGDRLNPNGDIYGDGYPDIAERATAPHYPTVVWSRWSGVDQDLVWSEWLPAVGWTDPAWLVFDSSDHGNDQDADVRFDSQNHAYVVWCRETNGVGSVLFSVRVSDGWTTPYRVSFEGTDSRDPLLSGFTDHGGILVEYDTPEGRVTRLVELTHPTSITDDINPLIRVTTIP